MKKLPLTKEQQRELQWLVGGHIDVTEKERIRGQIILSLYEGLMIDAIMQLTGYKRRRIFQVRKAYLEYGLTGIMDKQKSNKQGTLKQKEYYEIKAILVQKTPLDYGYQSKFWTTIILADLIEFCYGIRFASNASYDLLFKSILFTYHKSKILVNNRKQIKVKTWKNKTKKYLDVTWQAKGYCLND